MIDRNNLNSGIEQQTAMNRVKNSKAIVRKTGSFVNIDSRGNVSFDIPLDVNPLVKNNKEARGKLQQKIQEDVEKAQRFLAKNSAGMETALDGYSTILPEAIEYNINDLGTYFDGSQVTIDDILGTNRTNSHIRPFVDTIKYLVSKPIGVETDRNTGINRLAAGTVSSIRSAITSKKETKSFEVYSQERAVGYNVREEARAKANNFFNIDPKGEDFRQTFEEMRRQKNQVLLFGNDSFTGLNNINDVSPNVAGSELFFTKDLNLMADTEFFNFDIQLSTYTRKPEFNFCKKNRFLLPKKQYDLLMKMPFKADALTNMVIPADKGGFWNRINQIELTKIGRASCRERV